MKKPVKLLSTALIAGSLLAGCGANGNNNAGQMGKKATENVNYRTNQTAPNQADHLNNATLNNGTNTANQMVNTYTFNNQTAQKVANKVNEIKGVTYATTLINGNNVIVGVTTAGNVKDTSALKSRVRDVVQNYVGNRQVRVITDQRVVNRMNTVNNRIQNGSTGREVSSDVRAIFSDLGDIFQRPFQNNAR